MNRLGDREHPKILVSGIGGGCFSREIAVKKHGWLRKANDIKHSK